MYIPTCCNVCSSFSTCGLQRATRPMTHIICDFSISPMSKVCRCLAVATMISACSATSSKLGIGVARTSLSAFVSVAPFNNYSNMRHSSNQHAADMRMSTAADPRRKSGSSLPVTDREDDEMQTPWAMAKKKQGNTKNRFRQHVNPLARRFQMQTDLPEDWPRCAFDDPSLPLHLDIGCGKGGFLLELATTRQQQSAGGNDPRNYLGLEIRPNVAIHAKERLPRWNLSGKVDFIGCNANVDLRRLLTLYEENGGGKIDLVSVQFPDPHFKASHAKRRVVTPELVTVLEDFLEEGKEVFIQSDVKEVFDDMRERFRERSQYFEDNVRNFDEFLPENPIGVPTEREISVLDQDLPVYRTIFKRTGMELL